MPRKIQATGPRNAKYMIIGEAPGFHEEQQGEPFVGSSGLELDRMLAEAGILRSDCFITNVCPYRPPNNELIHFFLTRDVGRAGNKPSVNGLFPNELVMEGLAELYKDIIEIKPNIIILFGNYPLWALTECSELAHDKKHKGFDMPTGIGKWRGSLLPNIIFHDGVPHLASRNNVAGPFPIKAIPTFHPANILRVWENRADTVHDLRRVKREGLFPEYKTRPLNLLVRPSFKDAMDSLNGLRACSSDGHIAVDIQTRLRHISF